MAIEGETLASAAKLVETLEQTSHAFEQTAALAEQEAARRAAAGREDAEDERRVAAAARAAAERARAHAGEWRQYLQDKGVVIAPGGSGLAGPEDAPARASLEDLAEQTEARAARARSHAEAARLLAAREAEQGDQRAAKLHSREATTHEKAARVSEETAALYRGRLSAQRPPPGR